MNYIRNRCGFVKKRELIMLNHVTTGVNHVIQVWHMPRALNVKVSGLGCHEEIKTMLM